MVFLKTSVKEGEVSVFELIHGEMLALFGLDLAEVVEPSPTKYRIKQNGINLIKDSESA